MARINLGIDIGSTTVKNGYLDNRKIIYQAI